MMHVFLAVTLLCLASACAAALQDPPFIFEFPNDSIEHEIQDHTEKVTETDLTQEFTTISSNLPNLNSCAYPGTCPSLVDARNCQKCHVGYAKDQEDDTKCKYANEDENSYLLTSMYDTVALISLDTKNSTPLLQNGKFAYTHGVDYNFRTNTIFWFSNTDKKIYTAPLLNYADSETKSIMHDSSPDISGIAVDWIYNHLYWFDLQNDFVVSNFNGTMKKVLFNDGFNWPLSIVVNPLSGWMYWTDSYLDQILRVSLDGSRREVILDTASDPQGLALDFVENRLYWSQGSGFSSIWSSNLDGSDQKMIFKSTEIQLTGGDFRKIALFDKFIYFINWSSDVVYRVNKCNGQDLETFYNSTSHIWDIKSYHSTMQPEGDNLCSKRMDQCSHFCFPAPSLGSDNTASRTTCACPKGLNLSSDQRNCVSEFETLVPV